MRLVISQPNFFPWIGMFEQIRLADIYVNYCDVQFSKGSFANRVQLKSPTGIKWLTVPLENFNLGAKIDEVKPSHNADWRIDHLRLLTQLYSSAPFFRDAIRIVEMVYEGDCSTVAQISHQSVMAICQYFNLDSGCRFVESRTLNIDGKGSDRVLKIAKHLNATDYITGHGAKNYLEHEQFNASGISVSYMNYLKAPYPQLYGSFTPYVSALDLIAMTGKEGINFILSETLDWRKFVNG